MKRPVLGAVVAAVLVVTAAAQASAAPYEPPPCNPPTWDGRLPAHVGTPGGAQVWMDPVLAPGDPFVDQASTLRYVGLSELGTTSGATVTFQLPIEVDGATLAFAGHTYTLDASGRTASWSIPADTSGRQPALLGTTISGHPGPSYAVRLLVLPPGVPPPSGPVVIPRCNPPPPQVCARYGARLAALAGSRSRARLQRGAVGRACTVRVPGVGASSFTTALARVRAAGLLVAVPRFPRFTIALPEQGWNRLETYVVSGEQPAAGTRVARGSVVRLTIPPPRFPGPVATMAIPIERQPVVPAPNLVGLTYRAAFAASQAPIGLWVKVDRAPPLHAAASRCGEDAFVVSAQQPPAGTPLPTYGVVPGQLGVSPVASTITLSLATSCSG
jgi:hypothetical protein